MPKDKKQPAETTPVGKIKWQETIEDGVENAPAAFLKLFKGENLGKMLVKLA